MKKIVGILSAAALLATSVFAEQPKANLSVMNFEGNAWVSWGVDLDDDNKTGFNNGTDVNFSVRLFDNGDRVTEGSDIWAELKIQNWDGVKIDKNANGGNINSASFGTYVDVAKLHFGNFYIGIKEGDTMTGEYKFLAALRAPTDAGNAETKMENVGPADYKYGITLGYGTDDFGIDVDVRSKEVNNSKYSNKYAIAAEAQLKDTNSFVPGLWVDGGYSMNFDDSDTQGFSGTISYKLSLNDTYWLRPSVAYTGLIAQKDADLEHAVNAGLMLGWGDPAQIWGAGLYYLNEGDYSNNFDPTDPTKCYMADLNDFKACPGISVNAYIPTDDDTDPVIFASLYTGDIVPNLKAYAWSGIWAGDDPWVEAKGAIKYTINIDPASVTPQVGFKMANDNTVAERLNISAGVDVAGLINNTTFTLKYTSGDLKAEPDAKLGTIDFTTKIAF